MCYYFVYMMPIVRACVLLMIATVNLHDEGIENSNDQTARQPYKRPGGMREAIKSAAPEWEQGVLNCLSNSSDF